MVQGSCMPAAWLLRPKPPHAMPSNNTACARRMARTIVCVASWALGACAFWRLRRRGRGGMTDALHMPHTVQFVVSKQAIKQAGLGAVCCGVV